MNFRPFLRTVGWLALATIAAGTWGCTLLRTPEPPPEKKFDPPTQYNAPKVAIANAFRPSDSIVIRLDMATGREEHVKMVDEEGNIEMPFVGKIKIGGMTVNQAQEAIRKVYVPRYYSYLTVTATLQTPRMVYLSGEVRGQGGSLPHREDMTVYRLIMQAGGFSEFAKKREVVLTRDGKQTIVDCVKIEQNPELDIPLLPGDNVLVPKSIF
ncbi:MAG: polysaccharide biosynthesis/export family protein [Verrucomicrobia bacterium]|nr:polysaccharide biosynthesis/export family protein [Verrucomicrobiota bacterium]